MKSAILFAIVLLIPTAYAALYADVTFTVSETGEVSIVGDTNYPPFEGTTQRLTSKQGNYWVLNITAPDFEEYVYHIKLPPRATINYIKSSSPVRIEDHMGTLIVTGTGSKKPIEVIIQYSIEKGEASAAIRNAVIALFIIGLAAVLAKYVIGKKTKQKSTKEEVVTEIKTKQLDRKRFTDRQLEIIDYLQKQGTVTQAELEKALGLPKSSLSRNIETLAQKGIIFKESKGMSNVVGLKE